LQVIDGTKEGKDDYRNLMDEGRKRVLARKNEPKWLPQFHLVVTNGLSKSFL
jgi:hypothetical protein